MESFGALVKSLMRTAVVGCARAETECQVCKKILNLHFYILIHLR